MHFTEKVRNLVVTGSASGIGLVVGGAIAFLALTHHTHKTVRHHIKKRAERKQKEAETKAAAIAEEMARVPLLVALKPSQ